MMEMYYWLYFVLLSSVSANEYYVWANGRHDCPDNDSIPCHNLSYYYTNQEYFASDTVFYFLEGRHVLALSGLLLVSNVSNLTLRGTNEDRVQGFYDTVIQSSAVIECNSESGLAIVNSSHVTLEHITIANCGSKTPDGSVNASVSVYLNNVRNIMLNYVSVQNGSGAGVILLNCLDLFLTESSFAQNNAIETDTYYLNGGNVFITYDSQLNDYEMCDEYNVTILRTNSSLGLSDKIAGHGGGIQIVLSKFTGYTFHFLIESNVFWGNFGRQGGNLDFFVSSACCYTFRLSNSLLAEASGEFGAGMIIDHVGNSDTGGDDNLTIIIENTNFINNKAISGGGLSVYWFRNSHTATVIIRNCTIQGNVGESGFGILAYSTKDLLRCSSLVIEMSNTTIDSNKGKMTITDSPKGSVVFIDVHAILDYVTIQNHPSSGLLAIASTVTFRHDNYFISNAGINGGGIAMYDSSVLVIDPPANLSFRDNSATKFGGAIYILQEININYLLVTDDCFYRVMRDENSTWYLFESNTAAISGDILYGGNVSHCSDFEYQFGLFSNAIGSSPISSDAIQVCFCEAGLQNCSLMNQTISLKPGETHFVSLAVVGQENGLTKGTVRLTQNNLGDIGVLDFNATCSNVSFTVSAENPIYATLISSEAPQDDEFAKIINVNVEQCPPAFAQVDKCECDEILSDLGFSCNIDTETISCDTSTCAKVWVKYINTTDCQELVVSKHCPFDYCSIPDGTEFSVTKTPDYQCANNRSGLLCGKCADGFSLVLGTNNCKKCSNAHIALFIPFALAGIALVALIVTLNMTVTSGTINGLIFYANIIKLYEHIIFSDGQLPILHGFISWVNMDLGIETCFFNGMNACSKTWLQFVFPVYIWLLVLAIILIARQFPISMKIVTKNAVPVLATLVLLSYTKLIRATISALYIASVGCNGVVWRVDPDATNSACYIILVVTSVMILLLLILPYTLFLLFLPLIAGPLSNYILLLRKLSNKLKPFIDAYAGPYKDRFRFWTGLLLLVRVILALAVPFDESASFSIDLLVFILIGLLTVYVVFNGVYQSKLKSYMEAFFILNLTIVGYVSSEQQDEFQTKRLIYLVILVFSVLIVFCGLVLYYCYKRARDSEYVQTKLLPVLVKLHLKKVDSEQELPELGNTNINEGGTMMKRVTNDRPVNTENSTVYTAKSYTSTTLPTPNSSPLPVRRESILFDEDDNRKRRASKY